MQTSQSLVQYKPKPPTKAPPHRSRVRIRTYMLHVCALSITACVMRYALSMQVPIEVIWRALDSARINNVSDRPRFSRQGRSQSNSNLAPIASSKDETRPRRDWRGTRRRTSPAAGLRASSSSWSATCVLHSRGGGRLDVRSNSETRRRVVSHR